MAAGRFVEAGYLILLATACLVLAHPDTKKTTDDLASCEINDRASGNFGVADFAVFATCMKTKGYALDLERQSKRGISCSKDEVPEIDPSCYRSSTLLHIIHVTRQTATQLALPA
jgi:hypothetical protein